MTFAERLIRWPAWLLVTLVSVLPVGMGLVDYATRTDFEFLIFFLIPLFMVIWRCSSTC